MRQTGTDSTTDKKYLWVNFAFYFTKSKSFSENDSEIPGNILDVSMATTGAFRNQTLHLKWQVCMSNLY